MTLFDLMQIMKAVEIIKTLPQNNERTKLILLFIKELSANVQNCCTLWWSRWAEWEEVGANKRAKELLKEIEEFEALLLT